MKRILVLTVALMVSACATINEGFINIQPSDSKETVRNLVGAPEDRQFKGKNEAWQYCKTGTSLGVSSFRIVWFFDGKVTGVSNRQIHGGGLCAGHFKEINWEDAPDSVIEIRKR